MNRIGTTKWPIGRLKDYAKQVSHSDLAAKMSFNLPIKRDRT